MGSDPDISSSLCPVRCLLCRLALIVALLSITCAAVLALASGFSSDDYIFLLSASSTPQRSAQPNVESANGGTAVSIAVPLTANARWPFFFRPGSRLLQRALFRGLGDRPFLYHLLNLALHITVCVLAAILALRLGASRTVAVWTSLVFAVLPIHAETIFWISAFPDLAMTLTYLAGLLVYMRYLQRPGWKAGGLVVACYAVSILFKECAISFPVALMVLALIDRPRGRGSFWPIGICLAASLPWYLWRGAAVSGTGVAGLGLSLNPLTWGRNLLFYIVQFLLPVRSMFRLWGFDNYYQLRHVLSPTPQTIIYISAVAAGITLAGVFLIRRWKSLPRPTRVGLVLGCAGILPFLAYPQSGPRFLYLGSVGWSLAIAGWGGENLRRSVLRGVFFCWVIVMSLSLVERASAWYHADQLSKRVLQAAMDAREQVPPERTTVFSDLPSRYKGAYVYSFGFREALTFKTGVRYDRILDFDRDIGDTCGVPRDAAWFTWDGEEFRLRDSGRGVENGP